VTDNINQLLHFFFPFHSLKLIFEKKKELINIPLLLIVKIDVLLFKLQKCWLTNFVDLFKNSFEDFEMKTHKIRRHTQTSTQHLTQNIRGMLKQDSLFELFEACWNVTAYISRRKKWRVKKQGKPEKLMILFTKTFIPHSFFNQKKS